MARNHSANRDGLTQGAGDTPAPGGRPEGAGSTTSAEPRPPWVVVLGAYDAHGDLVWHILASAGVEDAEGMHQEVFMQYYFSYETGACPTMSGPCSAPSPGA